MTHFTIYYRYLTDSSISYRYEMPETLDNKKFSAIYPQVKDIFSSTQSAADADYDRDEELIYQREKALYTLLEQQYPEWCIGARQKFIDKYSKEIETENPEHKAFNEACLVAEGCRLNLSIDMLAGGPKELSQMYRDKYAMTASLLYTVEFDNDDEKTREEAEADPMCIEMGITEADYSRYQDYKEENNPDGEDDYEDIEDAVPNWADEVYSTICAIETEQYRANAKPGDDYYEDCQNPEWNISDVAEIFVDIECFYDPFEK